MLPSSSASRWWAARACCRERFQAKRCANRHCAIGACKEARLSLAVELRGDAPLSALLLGVDAVIAAQDRFLQAQLARNQVELIRGKGVLLDANRVEVQRSRWKSRRGAMRRGCCSPRALGRGTCAAIEVDHEHISRQRFDLEPVVHAAQSMVVLGSGVIACEYASIFAPLRLQRSPCSTKPPSRSGFLDPALTQRFSGRISRDGR